MQEVLPRLERLGVRGPNVRTTCATRPGTITLIPNSRAACASRRSNVSQRQVQPPADRRMQCVRRPQHQIELPHVDIRPPKVSGLNVHRLAVPMTAPGVESNQSRPWRSSAVDRRSPDKSRQRGGNLCGSEFAYHNCRAILLYERNNGQAARFRHTSVGTNTLASR